MAFQPAVSAPAAKPAVLTEQGSAPVVVAAASVTDAPVAERYLVLGTFRQRENAEVLASRLLDVGAIITDPAPGVSQFHRVVIGPISAKSAPAKRQQVARLGVKDAWQTVLCLDLHAVEASCDAVPTETAHVAPVPAVVPAAAAAPMIARPAEVTGSLAFAPTLPLSTRPIY